MKTTKNILAVACVLAFGTQAFANFAGNSGYIAKTHYNNPHVGETFVSFDWDANTNLYYSTGRPDWNLGMSLYRHDGTTASNLFTAAGVFAGARVTRIGNYVYFNDGGDYARYTCDYFKYDPATGQIPTRIIDSDGTGTDLLDLQAHGSSAELWAAGGWSSRIQYTTLDAGGNPVSMPPIVLGTIGNSSGPMAFDANGNLYYVNGYVGEGDPKVFRWTAAEVMAAVTNPSGSQLSPIGHEWATITGGFSGSTGMACDDEGNVILAATAFGSPSEVRLYRVSAAGTNIGMTVIATTPSRAETVRYRAGVIYVSDETGIAAITFSLNVASGVTVDTVYDNPHAGETFVSFDWDLNTNLYYSTGRPDWNLGMSIYRYDGTTTSNLYTAAGVYAGSRVTRIGAYVYFNDGGDFDRYTCDYFKYDPAAGLVPTQTIDSVGTGTDLLGLQARGSSPELWAAGGWSSKIQYTTLNTVGNPVSVPPVALGTIGNSSGPLAFDGSGNLFYVNGYVGAGNPEIFRWTAAEVAAAVMNPSGSPLNPEGHAWATITGGFSGASGMACDDKGNVVMTTTAFGSPSEVRRYLVDASGGNDGVETLAQAPGRAETVRCANHKVYFSTEEGLFALSSLSVVVGTNSLAVPEGASTTFGVKLDAQPSGTVTLNVSRISGDADITVAGGTAIEFTPGNWDTTQTVTLSAAEDDDDNVAGSATIVCHLDAIGATDAEVTATEEDDDYTLTVTAVDGTVSRDPARTYYDYGRTVDLTVTAAAYYTFTGWSGDASGTDNPLTLTMDKDKSVTASFWAELATHGVPVAWLDAYGLTNAPSDEEIMTDLDGDGQFAWQEFYAGTDPNNSTSVFAVVDFGRLNGSNYVVWLGGTNGSGRPFAALGSDNLREGWTLLDGEVHRSVSGTNTWWDNSGISNRFYRIQVNTEQ